jgi:hypothetical protein
LAGYLLRRFLDKNYITHAIACLPMSQVETIAKFLCGEFNFKVTHTSYSLVKDIDDLNRMIVGRYKKGVHIHDLIIPNKMLHCSDISDFPKKFQ